MITSGQLRAARGLLDWTRVDLAKAAGLSPETIKNIEHGSFRPQEDTREAIIRAFRNHDVEFTENEGVCKRHEQVFRFGGKDGFRRFIDDVYIEAQKPSAARGGDKPIYVSSVDDRLFMEHLGDYLQTHIKRMAELKNTTIYILIKDRLHSQTEEEINSPTYREFRKDPRQISGNVPFYVYGDKLAILILEENKEPQIVVIASSAVARAYREQFLVLWQNAQSV